MRTRHSLKMTRKIYRKRVKSSSCRGKSFTKCRLKYGCKRTRGNKRKSYCRKMKNRSV